MFIALKMPSTSFHNDSRKCKNVQCPFTETMCTSFESPDIFLMCLQNRWLIPKIFVKTFLPHFMSKLSCFIASQKKLWLPLTVLRLMALVMFLVAHEKVSEITGRIQILATSRRKAQSGINFTPAKYYIVLATRYPPCHHCMRVSGSFVWLRTSGNRTVVHVQLWSVTMSSPSTQVRGTALSRSCLVSQLAHDRMSTCAESVLQEAHVRPSPPSLWEEVFGKADKRLLLSFFVKTFGRLVTVFVFHPTVAPDLFQIFNNLQSRSINFCEHTTGKQHN